MKFLKPFRKLFPLLILFFISCVSKADNNPMNADIVVDMNGTGNYTTIQAAIDAVPSNSDRRTIIYLKRGIYNTEKLIVPSDKKNVTIIGESREESIISYHIYDCTSPESGNKCPAEDAAKWKSDNIRTSATLTILGDGFRAENLTVQNTAGPVGQALALTIQADKVVFINCDIKGYQDTIYLWTEAKRSYFENCLVVGRTDYIYGAGIGYFNKCEIRTWGGGYITAPSTPQTQTYGYVFYECKLTYGTNSPRSGDDGAKFALGRPWHGYPKVAWLYCDFCAEVDPLGWPTTWNMDYAATSADLHLYEYKNTGPGADMSGRAKWAGLRAMTDEEATDYSIQKVMGGSDNWDPTAEAPLVKIYTWLGTGNADSWLNAANWDPNGVPAKGESAEVIAEVKVIADGKTFEADLTVKDGATLQVDSNSTVSYLSIGNATISTNSEVELAGKISTKDNTNIQSEGKLTISAKIIGVHNINLNGSGSVTLNANNSDFSGDWIVERGSLTASSANSIGNGGVTIKSGAGFVIANQNAMQPKSPLRIENGSSITLLADITISEFSINGVLQGVGEYSATTNPTILKGTGKIIIGRPSVFTFIGGSNGNWDDATHFSPALLPEAGEKVVVKSNEIETTPTVFTANLLMESGASLRCRGVHKATGLITMNEGSKISYATSGAGFTIDAPILINGKVTMSMNSSNTAGNSLILPGNIQGTGTVVAQNTRNVTTQATLILQGDNAGFSGIWDLAQANANPQGVAAIDGQSANAFGTGTITLAGINKAIFSHEKCLGDTLRINLSKGKMVLSTDVKVKRFFLNGAGQGEGTYTASTNPDLFEGTGSLIVSEGGTLKKTFSKERIKISNTLIELIGANTSATIYNNLSSIFNCQIIN